MVRSVHVCTFSALDDVKRSTTYESLKAAALRAGRFSVFEATANDHAAALFSQLERDPTVATDRTKFGYPWIAVTKKEE